MVTWLDSVIVMIFIVVVLVEIKRGFGRTLFDFLAILISLRGAFMLKDPLANAIHFSANPASNAGTVYLVTFLLLTAILVFLGHLIHSTTLVSADYLDPALGGVLGAFVAVMLCHALVFAVFTMQGADPQTSMAANSALGYEFLEFPTFHKVVYFLYNFNRDSYDGP